MLSGEAIDGIRVFLMIFFNGFFLGVFLGVFSTYRVGMGASFLKGSSGTSSPRQAGKGCVF